MGAEIKNKGRRGYTKSGYPIVWKRFAKKKVDTEGKTEEQVEAEIHAICMARLVEQEVHPTTQDAISTLKKKPSQKNKGKKNKKEKKATLDFVVAADSHCLHLKFNGKTTYHSTLEDLADSLYKQLIHKKVKNRDFVTDLATLKEIAVEARKEVIESVKLHEEG